MLKLLLKKQLLEIFRSYFYDAKKNKARSKISTAMYFVLFALLIVGLLGGIFTFLAAKLCTPLVSAGLDWLYFALMGLIAVMLGAFGSVFNTYAGLYLPKDNDLLLSMPIPVSSLVAARLLSVYLMGLLYSAVVILAGSHRLLGNSGRNCIFAFGWSGTDAFDLCLCADAFLHPWLGRCKDQPEAQTQGA